MGIENIDNNFDRGIIDRGHREIEIAKKEKEGEEITELTTENVGPGERDLEKKILRKSTDESKEELASQILRRLNPEKYKEVERMAQELADREAREKTKGLSPNEFFEEYNRLLNFYLEDLSGKAIEEIKSASGKKPTIH